MALNVYGLNFYENQLDILMTTGIPSFGCQTIIVLQVSKRTYWKGFLEKYFNFLNILSVGLTLSLT